jgi:hypothetical protein
MSDRPWSSFFLTSGSRGPSLRIAIALDSDLTLSRAQASIIEDIRSSDFATVAIVLVADARPIAGLKGWVWRAYQAFDRRRSGLADDANAREPAESLLAGVEVVEARRWESTHAIDSIESANQLDDQRVDVIIDLTSGGMDRTAPGGATQGVWTLLTDIDLRTRLIRVTLERIECDEQAGMALATGVFAADPLAMGASVATAAYGSTHLVIRALRDLHQAGSATGSWRADPTLSMADPRPSAHEPSAWEIARWIGPVIGAKVLSRIDRLITRRALLQHWRIAVRAGHRGSALLSAADMSGFEWIESPRGHAFADPFLIEQDSHVWLFFEDYSHADRRGVIACGEISPDGRLGATTTVLASDGHLSYPYVFFDGADAYMVPESSAEGVVRLYRARRYPSDWERVTVLYPAAAVDTSVWCQDDRWWFFTTLREPRGGASMLMLFSSSSLIGVWESHPMNPISLDIRDARGAGRIFRDAGRLVRPSQDCSLTYGYRFSLNEIVTLSPTSYAERPLVTIDPDWGHGLTATHTYARAGTVEATDGRIPRPRQEVL